MKNVMGVIYTGERDSYLRELTMMRAVAAMPVAGRYRVIDFIVSGMVNSGMRNIGVIMQKNYHSLMDHLGSGKEWDLHGKNDGLYILPPFLTREGVGGYTGNLDGLYANRNYFQRSRQEYVMLSNSLIVFNPSFYDMFAAYRKSGADVMMLYTKRPEMRRSEYGIYLQVEPDGTVSDLEIDPTQPRYESTCLDLCILRKDLLIDMIDQGVAHGYHDLTRDVFQRRMRDSGLRVYGYEYKDVCFRIDSVQSYYHFNLDLLNNDIRHQLFAEDRPVYTKVRDELPARYLDHATVIDSMTADGCIVDGYVENCVLFRGVMIGRGASVKNSVIMQDSIVEDGAQLENCILDKQAVIKRNGRLIGPRGYPIVISKNMSV